MLTIKFKHLSLADGDMVLDLGCGEGRHAIGLCYEAPSVKVVAVDISIKDLFTAKIKHQEFDSEAAKRCLYVQSDGENLPFPTASFDHVICSEVLEHIPNYQNFLNEIQRVLKPGGSFNVSVPRYWPEKICWKLSEAYYNVPGGHIRIFKSKALRKQIEAMRFNYRHRHWAHALHVPYWWLRCAFWSRGDTFFLARWYHKLLVWDLLKRPWITRGFEKLMDPLMGKSIVMYFKKAGPN